MSTKLRTDHRTLQAELERRAALAQTLEPARPLNDNAQLIFEKVIRSRERTTWSELDIENATNLAWTLDRLQQVQDKLELEDDTIVSPKGQMVVNPLFNVLDKLGTNARAFADKLGLSASQRGIKGMKQDKRNEADLKSQEDFGGSEDDLLA